MPEDLLDSIAVIGEGISAINNRLANMLPTDKGFSELEDERDKAVDDLHLLVKVFTKNSTLRFIKADDELAKVNADMKETLNDLQNMQKSIDVAARFVSAIDTIIASIGKIV